MKKLILRLRRGGRLIGSWELPTEGLEMALLDGDTGQEIATFTATAAAPEPVDEVPIAGLQREEGDDLTVPIPEPTEFSPSTKISRLREASDGEGDTPTWSSPTILQSQPEDDFTVPEPISLTDTLVRPRRRGATPKTPRNHARETRPAAIAPAVDPTDDGHPTEIDDTLKVPKVKIQSAEVWLRQSKRWRSAARLKAGTQVKIGDGSVGLSSAGWLLVDPGRALSGSATMMDGRSVVVSAGQQAMRLPPGSSVTITGGELGVYVRSEPVVPPAPSVPAPSSFTR